MIWVSAFLRAFSAGFAVKIPFAGYYCLDVTTLTKR